MWHENGFQLFGAYVMAFFALSFAIFAAALLAAWGWWGRRKEHRKPRSKALLGVGLGFLTATVAMAAGMSGHFSRVAFVSADENGDWTFRNPFFWPVGEIPAGQIRSVRPVSKQEYYYDDPAHRMRLTYSPSSRKVEYTVDYVCFVAGEQRWELPGLPFDLLSYLGYPSELQGVLLDDSWIPEHTMTADGPSFAGPVGYWSEVDPGSAVVAGTLRIVPYGEVNRVSWYSRGQRYGGNALFEGDELFVAWSNGPDASLLLVRVSADGYMEGRLAGVYGTARAIAVTGRGGAPGGATGTWKIPLQFKTGSDEATLTVSKSDGTYAATWESPGESLMGVGLGRGEWLAIGLGPAADTHGVAAYTAQGDHASGLFAVAGQSTTFPAQLVRPPGGATFQDPQAGQ